jgi:hypothetical protein
MRLSTKLVINLIQIIKNLEINDFVIKILKAVNGRKVCGNYSENDPAGSFRPRQVFLPCPFLLPAPHEY